MSTVISQSSTSAFPDRPVGDGMGLAIELAAGNDGQYLSLPVDSLAAPLHVRLMLCPVDVSGGSILLLRAVDDQQLAVADLLYATDDRRIELVLAEGETLSVELPADGPEWHCIEWAIDRTQNTAELWIDGQSADTASGLGALGDVHELQLGAVYKESGLTGRLDLDEWVIADAYIGPVVIDPSSDHADDPARWLVIYNRADSDSRQWVDHYRSVRAVPYANLCGLDLPSEEVISEAEFVQMRQDIEAYLDVNAMSGQIFGLLLGHGVPGYYLRTDSRNESIAGQLQRIDGWTNEVTNLLPLIEPLQRPDTEHFNGDRLTARIDGPALADSLALSDRAAALEAEGLGDGALATFWFDPVTDGSLYIGRVNEMLDWGDGVDRQRLLLPFEMTEPADPIVETGFNTITNDGFFWGWRSSEVPSGFFGDPPGRRVFCYQATNVAATGPTMRSTPGGWTLQATQAGYAAAVGCSRDTTLSAVPSPDRFFQALRFGWTLAEAWGVTAPLLRAGLELIGDPLLRLELTGAGWHVFGPIASPSQACDEEPLAVLHEKQTQWTIDPGLVPDEGQAALFRIYRSDTSGRLVDGGAAVEVQRIGGALVWRPPLPVWPIVSGWTAPLVEDQWRFDFLWARPFSRSGITQVELIEQRIGETEQVIDQSACSPLAHSVSFSRTAGTQARYRLRIQHAQGGWRLTPWSQWQVAKIPPVTDLQTISLT